MREKEELHLPGEAHLLCTFHLIAIIYIFRLLCLYVQGHIHSIIFNKYLLSDYYLPTVTKTGKNPCPYEAYILMKGDS